MHFLPYPVKFIKNNRHHSDGGILFYSTPLNSTLIDKWNQTIVADSSPTNQQQHFILLFIIRSFELIQHRPLGWSRSCLLLVIGLRSRTESDGGWVVEVRLMHLIVTAQSQAGRQAGSSCIIISWIVTSRFIIITSTVIIARTIIARTGTY